MDHTEHTENATLRNVVGDFISSYAQRDTTVSFSSWLSGRLCQELPDLTPEASAKLTAEIMAAVAGYDRTLQDLNSAIDAGQSKEEWLSEQLEAVYRDMPIEEAGKTLQQMEASLDSSNVQLMSTIDPTAVEGQVSAEAESVEWNRYSVKAMANNIGRQANMLALCSSASRPGTLWDKMSRSPPGRKRRTRNERKKISCSGGGSVRRFFAVRHHHHGLRRRRRGMGGRYGRPGMGGA